jgi:hypothetical protein
LFLYTLGRAWRETGIALAKAIQLPEVEGDIPRIRQGLQMWHARATENREDLLQLITAIQQMKLQRPGMNTEAMARFDRQRMLKESLLEQTVLTAVKMAAAEVCLEAALMVASGSDLETRTEGTMGSPRNSVETELRLTSGLIAAAIRKQPASAATLGARFIESLEDKPILYAPVVRGGNPREVLSIRIRQQCIQDALVALPRMGLVRWTLDLIETARNMERNLVPGHGAVTQFDDMFEVGFRELVEALVRATANRNSLLAAEEQDADTILITCLEQLTEHALGSWLQHSQTLRLSVMERLRSAPAWRSVVEFIERYGGDLFTQDFLFLGNIRAILHWGTENWLRSLRDEPRENGSYALVRALDRDISVGDAAQKLAVILEAVVENYDEYHDYNSTTTQSDRGELLFILLDFLRLRSEYDRVAWNLRPVVLSHRVLVRAGRTEAAQLWRRILHDRLGAEADRYQKKFTRLQKKYAVTMGTVAQRIAERFLQPMTIDRMQALIGPAIDELRQGKPSHAFELLEDEAELLMRIPLGSGVTAPKWLTALEDEAADFDPLADPRDEFREERPLAIDPYQLSIDELQEQLADEPDEK